MIGKLRRLERNKLELEIELLKETKRNSEPDPFANLMAIDGSNPYSDIMNRHANDDDPFANL
jgi:hypothetical protein